MGQEVITNEEGRKIVVELNGEWHYFQADDTSEAHPNQSVFNLPKNVADENQHRIWESKQCAREFSLQLIKDRVELVDLQVALLNSAGTSKNRLQEQLVQTEQRIKQLEAELEAAEMRTDFLINIANLPEPTYARKLKKWEQDHPPTSTFSGQNVRFQGKTDGYATTALVNGILLLPPDRPCDGRFESIDAETQALRWETAPTKFFSHTDSTVERQFVKRDFVECYGRLTAQQGGLKFLNLKFVVASNKGLQIFGMMPKDELLEVHLLNGEKVRLFNNQSSNGDWVVSQDAFVYNSIYTLGYREEKLLRNNEVDKVLVRWSKVKEQYEIFETDFLIQHFKCLDALLSKEN